MSAELIIQKCDLDAAIEYSKGDVVVFDCYPDFFDIMENGKYRSYNEFKMSQVRLVTEK